MPDEFKSLKDSMKAKCSALGSLQFTLHETEKVLELKAGAKTCRCLLGENGELEVYLLRDFASSEERFPDFKFRLQDGFAYFAGAAGRGESRHCLDELAAEYVGFVFERESKEKYG